MTLGYGGSCRGALGVSPGQVSGRIDQSHVIVALFGASVPHHVPVGGARWDPGGGGSPGPVGGAGPPLARRTGAPTVDWPPSAGSTPSGPWEDIYLVGSRFRRPSWPGCPGRPGPRMTPTLVFWACLHAALPHLTESRDLGHPGRPPFAAWSRRVGIGTADRPSRWTWGWPWPRSAGAELGGWVGGLGCGRAPLRWLCRQEDVT